MSETTGTDSTGGRSVVIGSLLVLVGAAGFSAKAVLIKLAYAAGAVDAITLMALRMAMSLPLFLIAAALAGSVDQTRPMTRTEWLIILGLGMIGYYFASFLDFKGLTYISAGLERLILFLYPTLVVLFSALIYSRRVSALEWLAVILSYAGIFLVVFDQIGRESGDLWIGIGLVFSSAVVFAFYMIGSGVMTRRIGSVRFTCYSMIVACLATGIHFSLESGSDLLGLPARIYGLALLMAVLSTVMPAFFMNAGIRRLGSGRASVISSAGPVATLVLAYFLLGERLGPLQLAGTALVLSGVYLVTRLSVREKA